MRVHLSLLGLSVVDLIVETDDAEPDEADAVQGMGSVESLHVAEGEPMGEAGFTKR